MNTPKIIYLQTCGSCENFRCAPEVCKDCEIDNPIDPEAVTWSREMVFETDAVYVKLEVVSHLYKLFRDQKDYFKTRINELLVECKRREAGFMKWYEDNFMSKSMEVSAACTSGIGPDDEPTKTSIRKGGQQ